MPDTINLDAPINLTDEGWVTVVLAGVEKRLDLWATFGDLTEISERCEGKPIKEWYAAVSLYIRELGFPECTHQAAHSFVTAMYGAYARRVVAMGPPTEGEAAPERTVDKVMRQLEEKAAEKAAVAAADDMITEDSARREE